jgi:hypothetical protein
VNGAQTLYMIVDAPDRDNVSDFVQPFAQAGTVVILPASPWSRSSAAADAMRWNRAPRDQAGMGVRRFGRVRKMGREEPEPQQGARSSRFPA